MRATQRTPRVSLTRALSRTLSHRRPLHRHILASFSPAQLDRYECFRRSVLSRGAVKKLTAAVAGSAPSLPTLIVIGGLAKQFVGELVEEGRRVMADRGEGGPLRPVHVQEAHRRLAARGALRLQSSARVACVLLRLLVC